MPDPRRFSPDIDGCEVRRQLGLGDRIVLGFSGFVRPWHGLNRVIDVMAHCGAAGTTALADRCSEEQ